jgi:hypothetical protein
LGHIFQAESVRLYGRIIHSIGGNKLGGKARLQLSGFIYIECSSGNVAFCTQVGKIRYIIFIVTLHCDEQAIGVFDTLGGKLLEQEVFSVALFRRNRICCDIPGPAMEKPMISP